MPKLRVGIVALYPWDRRKGEKKKHNKTKQKTKNQKKERKEKKHKSSSFQNRPFPVTPSLCFKARLRAKPLIWKGFFILMQKNLTRKVLHLASFWKWDFLELGNVLFNSKLHSRILRKRLQCKHNRSEK